MRRADDAQPSHRDEDGPTDPGSSERDRPVRSIDWSALSRAVVPVAVRDRAIAVRIWTETRTDDRGRAVEFTVEFHNRLPIPVSLRTDSPRAWTWAVDGVTDASSVPGSVPDRPSTISFARGERKRFRRRWDRRIRVSPSRWETVDPGTYTISVRLSVPDAKRRGLVDRTTVEIR